jgi:GDPmannose 4,6-dehydratase
MKTALIIGCHGQDGRILSNLLSRDNFRVLGISRTGLWCDDKLVSKEPNVADADSLLKLIKNEVLDEIYYLAACHKSSDETEGHVTDEWIQSENTHCRGLLNVLNAISVLNRRTKLFYASSCHVFGKPEQLPLDETSARNPSSIYAITKHIGGLLCKKYREEFGVFASVGILFNHEAPGRSNRFLASRLVSSAVRAARGSATPIEVGNANLNVDWSCAEDVCNAMRYILGASKPEEWVVATGQPHTIKEFWIIACKCAGISDPPPLVTVPNILKRPAYEYIGNPQKLMKATKWGPKIDFETMIANLVKWEINYGAHER